MRFLAILSSFLLLALFSNAQCWQKIASKHDHVVAIHLDGTLWNWGGASTGLRALKFPTILDTTNNWVDIAAGNQFYAAIKSNGTLYTWGDNSSGQLGNGGTTNAWGPVMLGTDSNWAKVSCGDGHMVAIKTDGTLWIWGRNNYGQLGKGLNRSNVNLPEQLGTDSNWVEVSAGKNHTLIKKSNNTLWFVGACYTSSIVSQLWQVGSTSDWASMSGGSFTDYAIKLNGQLFTWNNSNGRNTTPLIVGTANNWAKVDNSHTYSPEYHALFLKTNGTLWAIGTNQFGQLGTGTLTAQTGIPIQISTDNNWREIVAGSHYSFGIKTNNNFYAWGRNQHAQFGNGENKNTIKAINNNTSWKEISASVTSFNGHTLAIQNNGTLWAWGSNNDGQLGNGSTYTHQALPLKIGNDSTWTKISNGFHFSIGLKNNGTIWVWGRNGRSQLGLPGTITNRTSPVILNSDTDWVAIAAGGEYVLALKNNGTLWAWGYNFNGQLGNNSTTTITAPTQIGTDTTWMSISTGNQHSVALKKDSTLWTWGNNQHGQLGRSGNTNIPIQVGTSKWIDIAAGGMHTLGVQADGTLWAWGRNLYAQLGDNSTNNRSSPTRIGNDSTWVTVAAGYEHSLGLQADSTLWAWGRNGAGQVGDTVSYLDFLPKTFVPTKVNAQNDWKAINGGSVNSIALRTDGTLYTFGDSYVADNQLNFPQLGYVYASPILINVCNYCNTSFAFAQSICNGDTILFNGKPLYSAGVYRDTIPNSIACDSMITLSLAILNPATSVDIVSACNSYNWIDGNTYTTNNNTASYTLTNGASNGCDSIVNLNLTILNPASSVDVVSACSSFNWIDGNTYTANNNSATFTIANGAANGCDSVINLNLTILNPTTSIDVVSACNSFNWIDGNTYTTNNNSATFTIANGSTNGCDSIITLDLTVVNTDTSVSVNQNVLTANADFVNYQWVDCGNNYAAIAGEINKTFTATSNGNYAVILTNGNCIDTSNCKVVLGISVQNLLDNNLFQIYPNPNNGNFIIELNFETTLEMLDALGRIVYSEQNAKGTHNMQLTHLSNGVYFVKASTVNSQMVKRLVIKK